MHQHERAMCRIRKFQKYNSMSMMCEEAWMTQGVAVMSPEKMLVKKGLVCETAKKIVKKNRSKNLLLTAGNREQAGRYLVST